MSFDTLLELFLNREKTIKECLNSRAPFCQFYMDHEPYRIAKIQWIVAQEKRKGKEMQNKVPDMAKQGYELNKFTKKKKPKQNNQNANIE